MFIQENCYICNKIKCVFAWYNVLLISSMEMVKKWSNGSQTFTNGEMKFKPSRTILDLAWHTFTLEAVPFVSTLAGSKRRTLASWSPIITGLWWSAVCISNALWAVTTEVFSKLQVSNSNKVAVFMCAPEHNSPSVDHTCITGYTFPSCRLATH